MHLEKKGVINRMKVLCLLLACLLSASTGRSNALDSAKMLPADTMIMVSVESVDALQAAVKRTSFYELYQDPAMQDVARQVEAKIREGADEILKEFWNEMDIDTPPETMPWPQGRIVLGISLFPKEQEDSSGVKSTEPLVFMTVLADMGNHVDETKDVLLSLSASAREDGDKIERKRIAGIEMDIMQPEDEYDPVVSYGIKDNWLLITAADMDVKPDATESVAKRIGRDLSGSLAQNKGFAPARHALGDGEIFFFLNAEAIRTFVTGVTENEAKVEQITRALGLDNVTSIAMSAHIAPDRTRDFCAKTLIGVDGLMRGIPALLSPEAAPLKLNDRLVTRDLIGFFWANYEPAQLFDGIARMLGEAVYMDLNMLVQAGMMATAQDGGQQPVQLRSDVIAQVQAPLFVTSKIEKPYSLSSPGRFLVGLSVQDSQRLNVALARIHQTFIGRDPKLRRELLDQTIYLFPEGPAELEPSRPAAEEESSTTEQLAFAAARDNLVFGPIGDVEQAIRNLDTEPTDTIAADPMFRHARRHLPSQAGFYSYRNDRHYAEIGWTILKQMLAEVASEADETPNYEFNLTGRIKALLRQATKYVDLSKLPEFDAIEKYWGATVGFGQNRSGGIYMETIMLKPPRQ